MIVGHVKRVSFLDVVECAHLLCAEAVQIHMSSDGSVGAYAVEGLRNLWIINDCWHVKRVSFLDVVGCAHLLCAEAVQVHMSSDGSVGAYAPVGRHWR